tara:strand:+ start:1137 stop:1826 length:690 start_codon:yes stop_codon:yes gene_type:complete
MSRLNFFFYFIIIFSFISCKSINNESKAEGEILYNITYPTLDSSSIFFDMMPQTMNYTFSEEGSKSEISAGMGLFRSAYIRRSDSDTFIQTVKMLNKKYQTTYNEASFLALNPKFKNIEFKETEEDTLILGYQCKSVHFHFPDDSATYVIYFTNELGREYPNTGTPFDEIPGVMLKYTVENFGVVMDFTAAEITISEIDETTFEVNEDYVKITPKELKAQIESIFLMTE